MNVAIFSNSPGEVFSWVRPICVGLASKDPAIKIFVYLTPCQYATGHEKDVVQTFPNVCQVFSPTESIKQVVSPTMIPNVVVFLGGDPMYAKRLAKRCKVRCIGYGEHPFSGFDAYFRKSQYSDLMVSHLQPANQNQRDGIVILPGSRPEHLAVALPLMLKIVADQSPVTVMMSPFTAPDLMAHYRKQFPAITFCHMTDPNDLARFHCALTIPGTNTMQLASLQIPFLMILPTHDARILRLDGVMGLLLLIPGLGFILKRLILSVAVSPKRLYALPNQFFKRHVCPELVGRFSVDEARNALAQLQLTEHYNTIATELSKLSVIKSPLDAMLDAIVND
ncbi:MAG: hypothetical protein ACON35_08355 [Candidatus Marinamargulisbacteria bacterium]